MSSPKNSSQIRRGFPVLRLQAGALLLVALGCLPWAGSVRAEFVLQTLYTSPGTTTSFSSLVQAGDGNFYGTTPANGTSPGTVFRITSGGVFSTIFTFNAGVGSDPQGGLLLAADGELCGTARAGGRFGQGTIVKMSTSGALRWCHSLSGTEATRPMYALIQGKNGELYGTADGADSVIRTGTVFRVTAANGATTGLTALGGPVVYYRSTDGLVQAQDGNLYGTGQPTVDVIPQGIIYRVTTNGGFQSVYGFSGQVRPVGGVALGKDGCLYGTTAPTTLYKCGTVFRCTTNGTLTTIFTFSGTNGASPMTQLVSGSDGSFYGTTSMGGLSNRGTIFRVSTNGVLTTLAHFTGANGVGPGQLTQAADGNLYGTASALGGGGLIYRLVQRPAISNVALSNGAVVINWPSFTNAIYRVECATAPDAKQWTVLASIVAATGNTVSFATPCNVAGQGCFRVVLLP